MPVLDTKRLIEDRVEALQLYHKRAGVPRAELDVSGGVDSAVMLGLLVRAIGADNITAVYSGINSSRVSCERAQEAADAFGVKLIKIDLTEIFEKLIVQMRVAAVQAGYSGGSLYERCEADPTILGSIRSTLRAPVGRGFNRMLGNGIRHGTGNECEDKWLRFYQKGGDGEVDTNPIAMLTKGETYQLAIALGVPKSILRAIPSPDLQGVGDSHNDEAELIKTYGVEWTYSKVNLKTGEYTSVGTIERMSRLMDEFEEADYYPVKMDYDEGYSSFVSETVRRYFPANEFTWAEAVAFVNSAYKIEAATRHKMNPNCPAIGTRRMLIIDEIITNELP